MDGKEIFNEILNQILNQKIYIIGSLDYGKMWSATAVMAAMIGVLGLFAWGVMAIANKFDKADVTQVSKLFLSKLEDPIFLSFIANWLG